MAQPSQPVLILGMHRSGTSFLASLLQKLGVSIGDILLEGNAGNPRGHFEDRAFLDFQRRMVAKYRDGGPYLHDADILCDSELRFTPTPEEVAEGEAILRQQARPGVWGWKDPRTALLLDFWLDRLPEAKCILVYRHPLEVYWSFLKRQDFEVLARPASVFHSYHSYHLPALRRQEREPERFFAFEAQSGFSALPTLVAQLQSFLGLPETPLDLAETFAAEEFFANHTSAGQQALFSQVMSHAHGSYQRLQSLSAFPAVMPEAPVDAEKDAQARKICDELGTVFVWSSMGAREAYVPLLERFCLNQSFEDIAAARRSLINAQARARREELAQQQAMAVDYQRYVGEYEKYYTLYQSYYWAWQETARELHEARQR